VPAAVTVGTTPTAIPAASNSLVQNLGAAPVYLGDASVTTTNGFALPSKYAVSVKNGAGLYGVVATGSADVRVLPSADGVFQVPTP
jgi:hypothetical protein